MAHGVGLGELALVLAHAHRRVVARHLDHAVCADPVEARVADVADRHHAVLDHGQRQDAAHAREGRALRAAAHDLVVRDRDRLAHAILDPPGLALETLLEEVDRDRSGGFARGLAADAVHHDQDAALGVHVDPVLVVVADHARVGGAGTADGGAGRSAADDQRGAVVSQSVRNGHAGASSRRATSPRRRVPAAAASGARRGRSRARLGAEVDDDGPRQPDLGLARERHLDVPVHLLAVP